MASTTTPNSEEMPNVYIIEEVAIVKPKANMKNNIIENQKSNMINMILMKQRPSKAIETILNCQSEGQYCNTLTGPNCCSGIACVQAPIVGGVCHQW